ncbi:MAG: TRAP transporter small permease, partial [Betaproteobacteria bacterium]|nr:TRAP transporter small permease [Betaproteobacteria bacterium]
MVVMVFGNVVLRYAFDSGIALSEELSRFLFVWLTFVGAVVVARENAHMGVETLVVRFGSSGRRLCMIVSDALVLVCCAVFFWGTWRQAPLNASNIAPI